MDNAGNRFIADTTNHLIRKVTSNTITTVAGSLVNGSSSDGYPGDGGPATSALLNGPADVAVDSTGNLYIADTGKDAIRKVNTAQTISTIAGGGSSLGRARTAVAVKALRAKTSAGGDDGLGALRRRMDALLTQAHAVATRAERGLELLSVIQKGGEALERLSEERRGKTLLAG